MLAGWQNLGKGTLREAAEERLGTMKRDGYLPTRLVLSPVNQYCPKSPNSILHAFHGKLLDIFVGLLKQDVELFLLELYKFAAQSVDI